MPDCILQIKDEVNVKILNLDLNTRKLLTNKFKYEIPGARYLPAVRLGRWDGKVSYFQLSGSTYINLLPEIIPILEKITTTLTYKICVNTVLSLSLRLSQQLLSTHILGQKGIQQPVLLLIYEIIKLKSLIVFLAILNVYKK